MDVLGVLENSDSEGFHNIVVNIFDVILEDAPIYPPHALLELEPNIFLKVKAYVHTQVHIP